MRSLIAGFCSTLLVVSHASAQTIEPAGPAMSLAFPPMLFQQNDAQSNVQTDTQGAAQDATQPLHAAAVEHSDAYERRKKIHKYASFATLPLFATEFALGQSLYNTPANPGSKRALHGIVGAGIVGLFGVNTVTGAWNMFGEDRKDPEGRTLRLVHGLLMMAADVGFVVTDRLGPNSRSQRQALTFESRKATHRNVAIASISVGTAGYLLMLFGNH
ncbi:MAG TPA: hypothetical protein VGZ27_03570 [Vicinamibacterales bacterium]|jgi:hypothetical protein|nr:hypothetical protein [Vicinamibacterales bacterium]